MSDGFQHTRFGTYLGKLPDRFEGHVVADMFCLLRIELELAVQAKARLIAQSAGLELPVDDDVYAALAERDYLRKSIGRTGLLALEPLRVTSHRDYWNQHVLMQAGATRALQGALAANVWAAKLTCALRLRAPTACRLLLAFFAALRARRGDPPAVRPRTTSSAWRT